ncbi:WbqC family protein [Alphaproteobacteria bacterium]|nr:WbqC family protein [Alphaproteobacteria bacterium]
MILTAHQPVYLPWLGLFHKIALSDLFCFFDVVQYQRRDFNNRNLILGSGGTQWLTVPVFSKGRLDSKITDIKIQNRDWMAKHIRSIELNYRKTPFFRVYFPGLTNIMSTEFDYLVDLNFALLVYFLDALRIQTPVVKASSYDFVGEKSDLVLDMCKKLGCDKYIFGEQGQNYADRSSFHDAGVRIFFQKYNHPIYNQFSEEFVPFLSIIDLLFNHGERSLDVLMSGNVSKKDVLELFV